MAIKKPKNTVIGKESTVQAVEPIFKKDKLKYQSKNKGSSSKSSANKSDRSDRRTKSSYDSRDYRGDFISSTGKPTNDPRWYLNNPVLSRDVASIWFSKPTGSRLPRSVIAAGTPSFEYDVYQPGILAIPTMTTWGGLQPNTGGSAANDIMNLTAQKLYQYVVHANSRNISYDKKDLIMTLMAIDGVYQVITEAIRAYRLIAQYDPENKYVNKLLQAMHWDAEDLKSNVAEFRYYINWAITRVNKFYVPAIFDMYKAHMATYEHIYMDRPSNKAQFIVKYSQGVWLYDDVEGSLNYSVQLPDAQGNLIDWYLSYHTIADFKNVINEMIQRIENAQHLGVMQGDLLKAFGVEKMAQYAYLAIDMPIQPVYDEEFMLKLHNADIVAPLTPQIIGTNWESTMVYRDANGVSGNMVCFTKSPVGPTGITAFRQTEGLMVDLPNHIPASPENIMLMCLYKVLGSTAGSEKWHLSDVNPITVYLSQLPPEVLFTGLLYYDPDDMNNAIPVGTWANTHHDYLLRVGFMSHYSTYPLLTANQASNDPCYPIFWDTENITSLAWNTLLRVYDVVYWSLWASTEITTSVSRETRV